MPKDLVILAADKDTEFAVRGLLSRHHSLGISKPDYDLYVHSKHDPGCLIGSPDFLRIFVNSHHRALVIFDREGCGKENLSREEIERDVENRLTANGWDDRCSVIVLDPEVEIWVWSDSPHVDRILGWENRQPSLNEWMTNQGHIRPGDIKPSRPKEVFLQALRMSEIPKSSGLFQQLAKSVSLDGCIDPSFQKLRTLLRGWFPIS